MSGLEALYWAQEYPDEVSAIVGLDMAIPEFYDNMKFNIPLMKLSNWASDFGITRLIPNIAESDAIKGGTLSDNEKEIYKAVFYRRTATVTMINEVESVKENAKKVNERGIPQIPMLMFVSDGTGTGFDKEKWHEISKEYILEVQNGKYVELDCPHYVHNYEYETISDDIIEFLSD
jgi:hypothetical protein